MRKLVLLGVLLFCLDHANAGILRGTGKLVKISSKLGVKGVKKSSHIAWKIFY